MAPFRLLAIDLDGTLLDSNRTVPEVNRRALSRAYEAGIKVALVTGRRLPAALPSLRTLNLDFFAVLNGGALVKEGLDGPILRRELMPLAVSRDVLAVARQTSVTPVVHDGPDGEGRLLIESSAPLSRSLEEYLDKSTPPPSLVSDLSKVLTRDPVQIMFADTVREIRRVAKLLDEALEEKVSLARTEYEARDLALLDVLAPRATKDEALRFVARRSGILLEETMAIGDNWNDLGMLEAAGFAVVMANAAPELRSRGFAITGNNDEGGVAQAIERYVLKTKKRG